MMEWEGLVAPGQGQEGGSPTSKGQAFPDYDSWRKAEKMRVLEEVADCGRSQKWGYEGEEG